MTNVVSDTDPCNRIFILIHGTFARDTEWTQEPSELREVFSDRFAPGVLFHRFRWSGANSHRGRLVAATRLRKSIQRLKQKHPHAEVNLVAHSHGGNVALYALAAPQIARHVTSIVTMGTPFLWCRRRHLAQTTRVLGATTAVVGAATYIGIAVGLMVFMAILGERHDPYGEENFILTQAAVVLGYLTFGGLLLLWVSGHEIPRHAFFRAAKSQRAVSRRLRCRHIDSVHLLRVTIRGDEAERMLTFSWLVGEVPALIWRVTVVSLVVCVFALVIVYAAAASVLITAGKGTSVTPAELYGNRLLAISGFLFGAALSLAAATLICQVAMMVFPRIVRRLAFGHESLAETWLLRVWPSIDPPLVQFAARHYGYRRSLRMLNHSRFYQTSNMLSDMADWLGSGTAPESVLSPRHCRRSGILPNIKRRLRRLLRKLR